MRLRTRSSRLRRLLATALVLGVLPVSHAAAATPSQTPVRTQARLTEAELVGWFQSGGWRPAYRATVPPAELVAAYAAEGRGEGIAWDVAFVQAILETSWFNFPDHGQVRPAANNFAGMGAYDGSGGTSVFQFPDARTGVRAHMQHLRLYSDPDTNLAGSNLGSKLAEDRDARYPDRWRLVRRITSSDGSYTYAGQTRRWEDFGNGMWATDPFYSCKILSLYRQALLFNGKRAGDLPTNAACLRTWFMRLSNTGGSAEAEGYLGRAGEHVLACDWNGNGQDTPATFHAGQWRISNSRTGTTPTAVTYGARGDLPLCGDWDGDGKATIGIVRDGEWHLKDSLSGGASDHRFTFGRVTRGDVPVVGNWDGKAGDGIGIIRDGQWHLRNSLSGGAGEISFTYGRITRGDLPLVGDWNADGRDGIGIVRGGQWHLRNSLSGGPSQTAFVYGRVTAGDVPLVGDWNDDGRSTPAIVR